MGAISGGAGEPPMAVRLRSSDKPLVLTSQVASLMKWRETSPGGRAAHVLGVMPACGDGAG